MNMCIIFYKFVNLHRIDSMIESLVGAFVASAASVGKKSGK